MDRLWLLNVQSFLYKVELVLDLLPIKLLVAHFQKTGVLKVKDSRDLLVPVAHDKGSTQLVKLSLLESTISGREKRHQTQDSVHVVLAYHFGLQSCHDFLDTTLTAEDVDFHTVALLIVDATLSTLDVHSNVHMEID